MKTLLFSAAKSTEARQKARKTQGGSTFHERHSWTSKAKQKHQTPPAAPACVKWFPIFAFIRQFWRAEAVCAQKSLLFWTHHLLAFSSHVTERGITTLYSFASSPCCWASHLHLILLQYSEDAGDEGSCLEQQRRPSSTEVTRAPLSWSLQNECGQNSQKDTAAPLHTLHWCHGHSHFPYGGCVRLRQRRWYALGQSFLSHMTSSPPSPHWKQ